MRYLSLAEALLIAEAVTGLEASMLVRVCQLDLLDSAAGDDKLDGVGEMIGSRGADSGIDRR